MNETSARLGQIDLALQKIFQFTERVKIDFRVETFNLFNHNLFGEPTQQGLASGLSVSYSVYVGQLLC